MECFFFFFSISCWQTWPNKDMEPEWNKEITANDSISGHWLFQLPSSVFLCSRLDLPHCCRYMFMRAGKKCRSIKVAVFCQLFVGWMFCTIHRDLKINNKCCELQTLWFSLAFGFSLEFQLYFFKNWFLAVYMFVWWHAAELSPCHCHSNLVYTVRTSGSLMEHLLGCWHS